MSITFMICFSIVFSLYLPPFFILVGGQLLYNVVLVSAIHQHESAIGIPIKIFVLNKLRHFSQVKKKKILLEFKK